jgi:hypothetical protein
MFFLFVADELLDWDAGSARKQKSMTEKSHTSGPDPTMNCCI